MPASDRPSYDDSNRREAEMATQHAITDAQVGDWLEAHGVPGKPSRRGEIMEILGESGHEHYRVRWDDRHESIVFPADGVNVVGRAQPERAAP
jgi:hypothetical protein